MNYTITQLARKNNDFIITILNVDYCIEIFYYEKLLPYIGKEIDETTFLEIKAFQNGKDILKKYYSKIYNHQITQGDLKEIFYQNQLSTKDIHIILKCIQAEGYLNEEDFIHTYMPLYMQNKGIYVFKKFLIQHKISESTINFALENYVENEEYVYQYCVKYIQSKTSSTTLLKQNLFANLSNKGFSKKTILNVIEQLNFENEHTSLKKEIVKYYQKYNKELYKIVSKLVNKGYNIADIKKCLNELEGTINEN